MTGMKQLLKSFLFITTLLLITVSYAEQTVTLRVPVKLENLYPDVKSFSIGCRLTKSSSPSTNYAGGRKDINILGKGKYHGMVSVPIKVPDSISTIVNYWVCNIYLFRVSASGGCKPSYNTAVKACRAKAGSQLVTTVKGRLFGIRPVRNKFKMN
jgi:hypothetical protein